MYDMDMEFRFFWILIRIWILIYLYVFVYKILLLYGIDFFLILWNFLVEFILWRDILKFRVKIFGVFLIFLDCILIDYLLNVYVYLRSRCKDVYNSLNFEIWILSIVSFK